jgi:hypothetical protein
MNEREKLKELIAELKAIDAKLAEVDALNSRRDELIGSRWSKNEGEITKTKIAYEDSLYPIFPMGRLGSFGSTYRITSVDKKWIYVKRDGMGKEYTQQYSISTGWPIRSRDGYGGIDAEEALAIWHKHQEATVHVEAL